MLSRQIKPDSKTNVLRFYQALMPCLHETWEPLVLKAGYPFRQPKLVLATKAGGACGSAPTPSSSYYCPGDETITMQWESLVKYYKEDPLTVIDMMDIAGHEYSHHVQMLTNILISSDSQEGWSKSKATKLEWSRRLELQATCLARPSSARTRSRSGFTGQKLTYWEYRPSTPATSTTRTRSATTAPARPVESGRGHAFESADPASCNTFAAPRRRSAERRA